MVISYVRGRLPGLLRLADFQGKIDKLIFLEEPVLNSFNVFNCLFVEKKYIYILCNNIVQFFRFAICMILKSFIFRVNLL